MSEENMAIRLKFLIEKLGITPSQFADTCKIPRPTFSQILNGRNKKISDQIIRQIHEAYPEVSITWLLFNEGPIMMREHSESSESPGDSNDIGTLFIKDSDTKTKSSDNSSNINDAFRSENPEFPDYGVDEKKESKETGLKKGSETIEQSIKEDVKSLLKSKDFLSEIAKIQPKPRKVVSVTIYYDDSTFETFKPL